MIADNLFNIAMFVFVMMSIGLVLTFLEFRFGAPRRQQDRADRNKESDDWDGPVSWVNSTLGAIYKHGVSLERELH